MSAQTEELLARLQADEEEAALRLAAVCKPHRLEANFQEAERRAATIRALFVGTDWSGPSSGTPRANGLRSVYDDVIHGRLP